MDWFKRIVETLVAYFTRTRRPVYLLLTAFIAVLVATLGPEHKFSWKHQTASGVDEVQFGTSGVPGFINNAVALVALGVVAVCAIIMLLEIVRDFRAVGRKRVICVELRGMVDTSDSPLKDAIPRKFIGRREDCYFDVRDFLTGASPNVKRAIARLSQLPEQVGLRRGDVARSDVSLVAGGILPVPLLFYAGMLLNDGGSKEFFDWERTKRIWKELDAPDDGGRFEVLNMGSVTPGTDEVVLAVSVSYRIQDQNLEKAFGDVPAVHLQLLNSALNELWSAEKQEALVAQFLKAVSNLSDRGVIKVHLVLAAPTSLSLRLGSHYDRNMPEVFVYQYEPKQEPPYPWSVAMPRFDGDLATFIPTPQLSHQH